ncbi:hypothetical protein FE392_12320 [Xenorhabdus sp. 12]|uniref:Uncharacterized protein n=1 Tax=Xenorhabdus santafensis TaxID=2582833 RepID=A0ABU4SBE9_9GAMM|nr:hypothetical protein [Xenorhabdus sp. 12]MDX7988109.1 hypothetical protein [Xenorhabdus sp. 12]
MYKITVFITLSLLLSFFKSFAHEVNLEHEFRYITWKGPYFSNVITDYNSSSELEKVKKTFLGKNIFFTDGYVNITNACKYKYIAKKKTPIEIWMSDKTVDFYRHFLAKYSINIDSTTYTVLTLDNDDSCESEFSEFNIIDDTIMFINNDRAIFYFALPDERSEQDVFKSNSEAQNMTMRSFNALVKDNYNNMEHGDTLCKNIEIQPEELLGYESMTGCFFRGMNIVNSYLKYREKFNINNETLPEKIIENKNLEFKCEIECISVNFNWENERRLIVTQFFAGGETKLFFTQETYGTKIITKYDPD